MVRHEQTRPGARVSVRSLGRRPRARCALQTAANAARLAVRSCSIRSSAASYIHHCRNRNLSGVRDCESMRQRPLQLLARCAVTVGHPKPPDRGYIRRLADWLNMSTHPRPLGMPQYLSRQEGETAETRCLGSFVDLCTASLIKSFRGKSRSTMKLLHNRFWPQGAARGCSNYS